MMNSRAAGPFAWARVGGPKAVDEDDDGESVETKVFWTVRPSAGHDPISDGALTSKCSPHALAGFALRT